MNPLVQITPVPPLHQSTINTMACGYSYVIQEIRGVRLPQSPESYRGTEIHEVAAEYTNYCVRRKVKADWAEFDKISHGKGPEAAAILQGVRDSYSVEYEHVAATEWRFWLDKDFQPCGSHDFENIAYSGTQDIILLFNESQGGIDDWKSHPRPFEPPTPQSDMYTIAVFQMFPELEEVEFRYRFVRYQNCTRTWKYTRKDLPRLMETMRQHKARQRAYHEHPSKAPALPGNHCVYCPGLYARENAPHACPIPKDLNPYTTKDPHDRVKLAVWLREAQKANNLILKGWVDANGGKESPGIGYEDGNGKEYIYGPRPRQSFEYPMLAVTPLLQEYAETYPEDVTWIEKLNLSSTKLRGYLNTKKRANIHTRIEKEAAVKVTKVKTDLHLPNTGEEEEEENYGGE